MADPRSPQTILVRAPNPIGDLVMATGRLDDVRRSFPESRVTLMIKPGREGVVAGLDSFDEIVLDDSHLGLGRAQRLVRALRRRRLDLGIVMTQSLRTAIVIALGGARQRIGYAKGGQGRLLTRRVPVEKLPTGKWKPRPMPELYGRLVEAAGATLGEGWPRLVVTPDLEERYLSHRRELGIADGEDLIGVVPGASFGGSKLWPPEHIAELVDRVTERFGLRTILFAAPAERPIVDAILARTRTRPIDPGDRPIGLELLKPYVRGLRLLITMDTGPRHYATAFRVPTVCIMGPTHPDWTASHLDLQEVVRHDVPCGPCQLPTCPLDHRCMREITPAEVLDRIEDLERRLGSLSGGGETRASASDETEAGRRSR